MIRFYLRSRFYRVFGYTVASGFWLLATSRVDNNLPVAVVFVWLGLLFIVICPEFLIKYLFRYLLVSKR